MITDLIAFKILNLQMGGPGFSIEATIIGVVMERAMIVD